MADDDLLQTIIAADPGALLDLEYGTGRSAVFETPDAIATNLLAAALSGQQIAEFTPGKPGMKNDDRLMLPPLSGAARGVLDGSFTLAAQESRGAWLVPEQASLKVGAANLPGHLRSHPWHAMTIAHGDVARVRLGAVPDHLLTWALVIPLFDTLMTPITTRAAGSEGSPDDQRTAWADIVRTYQDLGLQVGKTLGVFAYGGGWSGLDRAGQTRARVALLDELAGQDLLDVARRFRARRVHTLAAATARKYRQGTPLARQVLTRALQPILSAYFGGGWLAFLDYAGLPPNSAEEIVTALPQPRLYVGGASKAAEVAAEQGFDVDDVHAMLAAFMGQTSSTSPVDERVVVLTRWWQQFDTIHARQTPGMPTLWQLVEEGNVRPVEGPAQPIYRQLLSPDVLADVDRLWDGVTLSRWPEVIVSEPFPHRQMAQTLGPALAFWHGAALTAWYVCEGPMSRSTLAGLRTYLRRELTALAGAGTPIHPSLFDELIQAEQYLGPPQQTEPEIRQTVQSGDATFTYTSGTWTRCDGFEILRDIVTRHRQGWTRRYLTEYLEQHWNQDLRSVSHQLNRRIAASGKPPTIRQFAGFAADAANHWFNGDLAGLYTALGEKTPAAPRRVDLLPTESHQFIHAVFRALGGETRKPNPIDIDDDQAEQRNWQIGHLACASLTYIQISEALGRSPYPTEFGAKQFEWAWAEGLEPGWRQYQTAIDEVRNQQQRFRAGHS
jgi:hypothetical protein